MGMIQLAISSPPQAVLAVVVFLVGGILAALQKSWPVACIAFGLAIAFWPWG